MVLFASHALSGPLPWGYHLTSVALHVLASLGVWALARRLLPEPEHAGAAFTAGLLFAVHSVHVEAVAWASGIIDVGATAAGVGMLWLLAARPLSMRRAVAGALAWLAALLFKENAAVLPALLVWELARHPTAPHERRSRLLRYGSLIIAGCMYVVLRFAAVGTRVSTTGWGHLPPGLWR